MKAWPLALLVLLSMVPAVKAYGVSCGINEFRAQYYHGDNFTDFDHEKCESSINTYIRRGSVIWRGSFQFNSGQHTFTARAQDGRIGVRVDGRTIIDGSGFLEGPLYVRGGYHEIIVRFYGGQGEVSVNWR